MEATRTHYTHTHTRTRTRALAHTRTRAHAHTHTHTMEGSVISTLSPAVQQVFPSVAHYITFTFSHLADAFVQSDVQGREYSSYEQ